MSSRSDISNSAAIAPPSMTVAGMVTIVAHFGDPGVNSR
jgi:hypothetical protein